MPSPTVKKLLRITALSAGIILILLLLLNWFFIQNARLIIKRIVEGETHGKVHVDIGRISISYFHPPIIDARDIRLGLMDSSGTHEVYAVRSERLYFQLRSLRSLFTQRKFLVDEIRAEGPTIEVFPQYKRKKNEGNSAFVFELGNVYKALDTLANKLEVKNIRITRGSFAVDQFQPGNHPARVKDIDFRLENFKAPDPGLSAGDSTHFLYSDNISLNSGRLELMFPDGHHGISYTSLSISTRDRDITIDSAHIFSTANDTTFNAVDLYFDRLRLINLDFQALYHAEKIKVDTVYCLNPAVNLKLDLTKKTTTRGDIMDSITFHGTIEQKVSQQKRLISTRGSDAPVNELSKMLGHLDIGFIDLQNSRISITTKNKDKVTPFTTRGNNFQVGGLQTGLEGEQPISVQKVAFAIRNYRAYSSDSMYHVMFDSVVYDNRNLFLKNFTLGPSDQNKERDIKKVSIPVFELKNISLNDIIARQFLKADELVLLNPVTLNYHYDVAKGGKGKGKPIAAIVAEVNKKISIGKVSVVNGSFLSQSLDDPRKKVDFQGIHSSIDAKEMLEAPTYVLMGHSIGVVAFRDGLISGPVNEIRLTDGQIQGREQLIRAGTMVINSRNGSLAITLRGARIKGYQFDNELKSLSVDSLRWESGEVSYHKPVPHEGARGQGKKPDWFVNAIDLHHTRIDVDLGGTTVRGDLDSLLLTGLHSTESGTPAFSGLDLALGKLVAAAPGLTATVTQINIHENAPGKLEQVVLHYENAGDTLDLNLPVVRLTPHIGKTLEDKSIHLDELVLQQPRIRAMWVGMTKADTLKTEKKPLKAEIAKLGIIKGDIGIRSLKGAAHMEVRAGDLDLDLKDVHIGDGDQAFSTGAFSESVSVFSLNSNDSLQVSTENGGITLKGQRISISKPGPGGKGSLRLDKARVDGLHAALQGRKQNKPLEFRDVALGVDDLALDSLDKAHIARKLKANPGLFVRNINFIDQNDKHDLAAYGIRFENRDHRVALDSFHFRPAMDRDSFNRMHQFQKDYMDVATGAIVIRGIDIEKLIADTVFRAERISISHPVLDIYKDKRLPFQHGIIKPLPTDLLVNKLKFGLQLDSLRLEDGVIHYDEFNDKTNSIAKIGLTHVNALLTGIRNREIRPDDSLRLVVHTDLLDTIGIRLHFRESYTDTLHGFLLTVRAAPTQLTVLNSFLPEMASARIISGHMDTLRMRAIGREYLAHGQMQLFYKDLKIQYLNKGDVLHKTFVTKLVTFFANNLILRKNNTNRNGTVFFERIRERSFINYWIKIVLSGALTSAGVKENKKQDKKFMKKVKKLNVPEIPDVAF